MTVASRWFVHFTAIAIALFAGCERSSPEPEVEPGPREEAKAEMTEKPVGVPACDKWVEKYVLCIDTKAPEPARRQMRQAIAQTEATWRRTAQTAEGRAALATACARMVEATRQATASMGCVW